MNSISSQLNADQQHADAHARLAAEFHSTGNGLPRRLAKAVRELANVLTRMPNHATPQLPQMPMMLNIRMMKTLIAAKCCRHAEVKDDDRADEDFEDDQELDLRDQVGFAGFIDQLGNFEHRFVDRQILELVIDDHPEQQTQRDNDQAIKRAVSGHR